MAHVARLMAVELKKRFKKYTDPANENHTPLFLMATALDPRYRLLLNPTQISCAKAAIMKEVYIFFYSLAMQEGLICILFYLSYCVD